MFKVGDEVFVKGNIAKIEEEGSYPISVGFDKGRAEWFEEEELIPVGKTYEQGLADAWELAKKISLPVSADGYKGEELEKIFGNSDHCWVLKRLTAEEALAKIEAYEKEKEIKVGDEVVHGCNGCETKFYVTYLTKNQIKGFSKNGDTHYFTFPNQYIRKTGKHIDIESLLRQIGE